jgi:hypothetical protein
VAALTDAHDLRIRRGEVGIDKRIDTCVHAQLPAVNNVLPRLRGQKKGSE